MAVSDLREAFDESSLKFAVDLHVWADLPEAFRAVVRASHRVVQEGPDDGGDLTSRP